MIARISLLARPMRRPLRRELLRERLDALVATFPISAITPDPLQLVLRYDDPRDQEVAGLIAAAFAYGRADIVVANIGRVLDRMRPSPFAYLSSFSAKRAARDFAGFAHRFHKTPELVDLFDRIAAAISKHGSLGELFRRCYRANEDDIGPSLAKFDPADPIRYDFAICRLGILDLCSRKRRKSNCDVCLLRDVCRFPVI